MGRTFTYRLPWPPSVNNYIRRGQNCSYMTKQGKRFREEACDAIREQGRHMLSGRLGVCIELVLPDKRKRDCDNHIKAPLDALQHAGVILDDEAIDDLRVRRLHVEPPGCCDVTITELSP